MSDRQVKMINILSRFIDYHLQSIVSIIRAKHVLTLHLTTANWRKLTTGSCCKNTPACYVILPDRVIPQFLELWSIFNALWWNTNFTLLYSNATTYGIKNDTVFPGRRLLHSSVTALCVSTSLPLVCFNIILAVLIQKLCKNIVIFTFFSLVAHVLERIKDTFKQMSCVDVTSPGVWWQTAFQRGKFVAK